MSRPGFSSTNSIAQPSRTQQIPTTVAGTSMPSTHDLQEPCVPITDISFGGHIACQLRISLVPSEGYDVEQALCDLPEALGGHARIYDLFSGELTLSLANHLRSLFPGLLNAEPSLKSLLGIGDRGVSNGTVRLQWARAPTYSSQWNPLYIPSIHNPEHRQYNDLDLSTSFALFSCREVDIDKLLGELIPWPTVFPTLSISTNRFSLAACIFLISGTFQALPAVPPSRTMNILHHRLIDLTENCSKLLPKEPLHHSLFPSDSSRSTLRPITINIFLPFSSIDGRVCAVFNCRLSQFPNRLSQLRQLTF